MFDSNDTYVQLLLEGDALFAMAASGQKDAAPDYVTSYIGSKRKLVDWIWKHTPDGVGSVLDAFCGSAVVAYMFKKQGLRVVANDRIRCTGVLFTQDVEAARAAYRLLKEGHPGGLDGMPHGSGAVFLLPP